MREGREGREKQHSTLVTTVGNWTLIPWENSGYWSENTFRLIQSRVKEAAALIHQFLSLTD